MLLKKLRIPRIGAKSSRAIIKDTCATDLWYAGNSCRDQSTVLLVTHANLVQDGRRERVYPAGRPAGKQAMVWVSKPTRAGSVARAKLVCTSEVVILTIQDVTGPWGIVQAKGSYTSVKHVDIN